MSEPTPPEDPLGETLSVYIQPVPCPFCGEVIAERPCPQCPARSAPSLDVDDLTADTTTLREALAACLADFDRDPPVSFVTDWLPRIARAAARSAPAEKLREADR